MSLEKRCSHEVMPADQNRGRSYFLERRVSLQVAGAHEATAKVRGSREIPYEVRLNWSHAADQSTLLVSCDCPRFADFVLCKHVWATILAFDHEHPTSPVAGDGPLEVDFEIPEEPAWLEETGELPAYVPEDEAEPSRAPVGPPSPAVRARPIRPVTWKQHFDSLRTSLTATARQGLGSHPRTWHRPRQAWYRLNVLETIDHGQLWIDLYQREAKKSGELGKLKRLHLTDREAATFGDPEDRELLRLFQTTMATAEHHSDYYPIGFGRAPRQTSSTILPIMYDVVLPRLCATGRFGWVEGPDDDPAAATALSWDEGPAWRLAVEVKCHGDKSSAVITGSLVRGRKTVALSEPVALLAAGVVVFRDTIARLEAKENFPWIRLLRNERQLVVAEDQVDTMMEELWKLPALPQLRFRVPDDWRLEEVRVPPRPRIALRSARFPRSSQVIEGEVSFEYDGHVVPARHLPSGIVDLAKRRVMVRDLEAEQAALAELTELGMHKPLGFEHERYDFWVSPKEFSKAVEQLVAAGWKVEAEGRSLYQPSAMNLQLTTGIDWLELRGEIDFGELRVGVPELLSAIRRGEKFVRLGDGTQGMLPDEWLHRYGPLANLVHATDGDAVRFLPSQAAIVDALLATEQEVDVDARFAQMRERLQSFEHIEPAGEPRGFFGELRPYQKEGLGWLRFLKDFGIGGCLADDMGLGKTIQVLALLQQRRLRPVPYEERRPSLIVVPRSLVYNWIDEAARFTPKLEILSYTGSGREELIDWFDEYNVVVTTYGTLRRDILQLKEIHFDYAILDEAQAIKNAASQTAKVCRLIRADHRLALTGTPVENHLGELWSIFEFLNPGMLGRLPVLKGLAGTRSPDSDALGAVARALRPFILRRTKEQVLKDLPEKTEQTLFCELDRKQRKLYEELRDHYRQSLMLRIAEVGLNRSKIQVLEALLRLRQAACHPGLLDPTRVNESSAKLDTLIEQLQEVLDEGHKALVFSQFTSLLAIVRQRLDRQKVTYEYLDGRTRRRKSKVNRFQNDPDCRLFLISLKAGGLGLNLTAAGYVFILDPWWNPAVEAQAVDRAHRIGQTRPVFAYRLICRETVEEKIMELQESKRELADAILSADQSMIRNLSAEDLQLLLS